MFWRKKTASIAVAITVNEFFFEHYLPNAIVTKKRGPDDRLTYIKHIADDFGETPLSKGSVAQIL